ncbi:MAG: PaaI family thioesterase [Anaerotruncus sp.]|nr:PaaI family thioesterase [Anaerotruncus sp.]
MNFQAQMDFINTHNPYMQLSGIRVLDLGVDYAVTGLEMDAQSCNPFGSLHGGAIYTMADCASGCAARSNGAIYVTLNGSINYIRGAKEGAIRANAQVVHRGRTTCVVRVEVHCGETLLADGSFTMFCVRQPEECGEFSLTPDQNGSK